MSQWKTDEHGNRRHKRRFRRRATPAYLYKYIEDTDRIPFGIELIAIHTARPKRKHSYLVGYVVRKWR